MTSQNPMMGEPEDEELQKLLRNANIYLRREDLDSAETNCRAAIDMARDNAEAYELLGDVLVKRGEAQEAAEAYHAAMKKAADPARPETKYAKIVLSLSEAARHESDLQAAMETPPTKSAQRSPVVGFLASMFWPGLGQWYNGENTKAVILASAYGAILLLLMVTGQLQALISVFVTLMVPVRTHAAAATQPGPFAVLLWGGAAAAWLYAVIDAPVRAGKAPKSPSSSYTEPDI
ncbi:MAG: tetratricopeptide repeat protein [Armatimonadetes bacterium]|nr:tetratricopeptide repeat protein [Armatimonadota bacterium]